MHRIKILFVFLIIISTSVKANEARDWLNKEIDIIISSYQNNNLPNENKFLMVENTINNNFAGTNFYAIIQL